MRVEMPFSPRSTPPTLHLLSIPPTWAGTPLILPLPGSATLHLGLLQIPQEMRISRDQLHPQTSQLLPTSLHFLVLSQRIRRATQAIRCSFRVSILRKRQV